MPLDESAVVAVALGLGIVFLVLGFLLGRKVTTLTVNRRWERQLPLLRRDAVERSRAVLTGRFSEHLAPYLPGFPYPPTEARFLGNPVDFVVFRGLDRKAPLEVVFVEVKTGRSSPSAVQRRLREVVERGRVRWMVYRVPGEVTGAQGLDRYLPR